MPHGLSFESLVLLHHHVEDCGRVHDNHGHIHDDQGFLRIANLTRLRHSYQLLGAVIGHGLLEGVHVGCQVLRRKHRRDLFVRITSRW